ncbi:MAG: ATP-binding protein [Chlamydiae bacterium]|nr:ATP-binding protein [Chlamydiota bacterium]
MIIELSVKNFSSFRELATLSLDAEPLKTGQSSLISTESKGKILPVIGIFGHNASGKSNLIKALIYMQWAMLNSDYLNQPTTKSPLLQPFLLNIESHKEPSFFQIVLWDTENKVEYRYGFEINAEHVVSEWLETVSKVKKNRRRQMIFLRKGQEFVKLDESVKGSISHLLNNVRPSALALTVFAQFADPISSEVVKLISRPSLTIVDGGAQEPLGYAMHQYYENPEFALRVLQLLKKLDLSIQDLKITREPFTEVHLKTIPNELKPLFGPTSEILRAVTTHKLHGSTKKNQYVEFDFASQESFGTRRLFALMTLALQMLDIGGVFVLDELGSSIHPFMSRELITLFQNPQTNPKGAQLIFCSHETFLLSKQVGLRQDQIWFTEKNAQEETVLRSLLEYNIRSECEFEKNYREGRFGAVPVTWN